MVEAHISGHSHPRVIASGWVHAELAPSVFKQMLDDELEQLRDAMVQEYINHKGVEEDEVEVPGARVPEAGDDAVVL
jgi:hypothetical protein